MAQVTLRNVAKVYAAGVPAVKDVNLSVKSREFLVIVGPSGCGKSTLLRMIAGLEEVTGGEIWIGNKLVNNIPPKDRDIAMVFQNYALYPHMSVFENMAFGLRLRGYHKREIDQRVREAAGILGIEHYLDRKPRELSGGERQRVAVGGPSCASRWSFCSMSRSRTLMRRCACRCAPRSARSTCACRPPWST